MVFSFLEFVFDLLFGRFGFGLDFFLNSHCILLLAGIIIVGFPVFYDVFEVRFEGFEFFIGNFEVLEGIYNVLECLNGGGVGCLPLDWAEDLEHSGNRECGKCVIEYGLDTFFV